MRQRVGEQSEGSKGSRGHPREAPPIFIRARRRLKFPDLQTSLPQIARENGCFPWVQGAQREAPACRRVAPARSGRGRWALAERARARRCRRGLCLWSHEQDERSRNQSSLRRVVPADVTLHARTGACLPRTRGPALYPAGSTFTIATSPSVGRRTTSDRS